jgi:hypothetical protein
MLPVTPSVSAVEHIHEHLQRIYESGPVELLIRGERKENVGKIERMSDGSTIRWTDNAPAWAIHRAAFEGSVNQIV